MKKQLGGAHATGPDGTIGERGVSLDDRRCDRAPFFRDVRSGKIGERIIEMPEKTHDTEFLRNPRSGFIAYVPSGSLKRGEALVMSGVTADGGQVTACTVCHGGDLRGLGPVPTLAGRSPSYLVRQLYDMQRGNRNGLWTPLMASVVAHLGPADLLTAGAYLASLKP